MHLIVEQAGRSQIDRARLREIENDLRRIEEPVAVVPPGADILREARGYAVADRVNVAYPASLEPLRTQAYALGHVPGGNHHRDSGCPFTEPHRPTGSRSSSLPIRTHILEPLRLR